MGKHNIWLRRAAQALFLVLWGFLFYTTRHQALGAIPQDLFLSTNPLVAALAAAASRIWVPAMLGALILIGLTLVFGRFFCGWICPLGTLFDITGRLWHGRVEKRLENEIAWRRVKYYLLVLVCFSALTGGQLHYWADPLVMLFRGITFGLVTSAPGAGSFSAVLLLLAVIGLSGITPRFWCRYLCPLGAFYGALSRFSLFRRRLKGCDGCKDRNRIRECQQHCPMNGAVSQQGSPDECVRCMSCQTVCRQADIRFVPALPFPTRREAVVDINRRTLLVSAGAGAVTGIALANARLGEAPSWRVVRPPMVADPVAFNALCVRCGQCLRSCPTGTLQPLTFEEGFAGLWTPAVTPDVGGCKDSCNACSNVCPTGAIPKFGPRREDKWALKMGSAAFESQRCISYAEGAVKPCLKCVEVCPNKAIVIDEGATPQRPRLVSFDRCVGCGQCETACLGMVQGEPALTLNNHGVGGVAVLVRDPSFRLPPTNPPEA